MKAPLPFDTHTYVKKLVAAGVPEHQAEVQAEALTDIAFANLATKDDIGALRADLRTLEERLGGRMQTLEERLGGRMQTLEERLDAKLDLLRQEFKAELSERMRQQMLWFFATQVALFGALFALFKLA